MTCNIPLSAKVLTFSKHLYHLLHENIQFIKINLRFLLYSKVGNSADNITFISQNLILSYISKYVNCQSAAQQISNVLKVWVLTVDN